MRPIPKDIITALSHLENITTRPMFGGHGVYKDGLIIGIIAEDDLYFKGSSEIETYYQSFGSVPFIYEGKHRPVKMSYWKVPNSVMQDSLLLTTWAEKAYIASRQAQFKKKPSSKTT